MARTATIVGRDSPNLEASYGRALRRMGWKIRFFDLVESLRRHEHFGRVGRYLNTFLPVEPWFHKANRDLFQHVLEHRPELLIITGTQPVRVGGLAQIKVACPATRLVLIWPDPLGCLDSSTTLTLPLYDLVATYNRETRPIFERLGARATVWLPFAADLEVHPPEVSVSRAQQSEFACEVLFVGNYRPEREKAVLSLLDAGINVSVYGTQQWRRQATAPDRLAAYWRGRPLFGREFVAASRSARLCMNVIDPGNYPAANMRFFENFAAAVPTMNSTCPEMSGDFPDGVATLYYAGNDMLVARAREALADPSLCAQLAAEGARRVRERHTYLHRAQTLVKHLDF